MTGRTVGPAYDYVIIGAGIVGLSTAWQLQQRRPTARILVLEKEIAPARHQSSHNSGVIHAGIYYAPGSLKAQFCAAGLEATARFCVANDIPYRRCGKLLVATSEIERGRMLHLHERARQNGLNVELVDQHLLRELEPNIAGVGAIHVKDTGVVDYSLVSAAMARRFEEMGGELRLNASVEALTESSAHIDIDVSGSGSVRARFLIACAGLMADRIARMLGVRSDFRIIPFRGEYYRLPDNRNDVVRHLIYPIPDPELPFLGVHLTKLIGGNVTVGPNAVLGWKREGYGRVNFSPADVSEMLRFGGFWRVMGTHLTSGLAEVRNSTFKSAYLRQVQKYCPGISRSELLPYPAGIRAQAVLRDGTLVQDFLFGESRRSLHVCNAPSPAATSAIPIGSYLCDRIPELL